MPTAEKTTPDVRDKIMKHLESDDRNLKWLSKKTGLSYIHLYFIFARKERILTQDNKNLINEKLGTSF